MPHVGVLREASRAPAEGGARTVWCDRSVRNVRDNSAGRPSNTRTNAVTETRNRCWNIDLMQSVLLKAMFAWSELG